MIANHAREIEYLRAKIAGFLHETPPKRSLAKKYGVKLNQLVELQIRRELQIERRQHEASRRLCLGATRGGTTCDGGSPDAQRVAS